MSIRILPAAEALLPELKRLWLSCFDDTPEYVDFFLRRRFPSSLSTIAEKNGRTIGAAYLLPARILDGGTLRPAFYLYALGVSPAFRNAGIGRQLLERSSAFAEEQDAVCFLRPASADLVRYYEKAGMRASHFAKDSVLHPSPLTGGAELQELKPETYASLWNNRYAGAGSVLWDENHLCYALAENSFSGGFAFTDPASNSFAVGQRRDTSLFLTECFSDETETFLAALCARMNATTVRFRQPATSSEPDAYPLVMTYNMHRPESAPMGLLLDGPLEEL